MSAQQWEELAEHIWYILSLPNEFYIVTLFSVNNVECCYPPPLTLCALALFAKLMALVELGRCVCKPGYGHLSGLSRDPADGDRVIGCPKPGPGGVEIEPQCGTPRIKARDVLGIVWQQPGDRLHDALLRYHTNADRGELKALTVEAWGPSPAIASDPRGLAARESQPAEPKLETGPAPPCADPDCPCHEHDRP